MIKNHFTGLSKEIFKKCSKNTKYKPTGKNYTDEIKQLVLTLNLPLKLIIFKTVFTPTSSIINKAMGNLC